MSDTPPADLLAKRQRAFLLSKFNAANAGELTAKQAADVPRWARKELDLTPDSATDLVEQLMGEQFLVSSKKGKAERVGITQAGRELLDSLAEFVPTEPPKPPKTPRAPKKSVAEQTADKLRAKVAGLGDKPVSLKPPGGTNPKPEAVAAFERTVRELIAEGKLFEHPGGKYGKRPPPTLSEVVRAEVQEVLATREGPFTPAELSKPKRGAGEGDRQAHHEALTAVLAELVTAKSLFPHPGGKYGQLPFVEPDHPDRELREVYTLHQFSRASGRTITQADIELAFPGKGKPDLKTLKAKFDHVARFRGQGCFEMGAPATRQTLEQLVASGDLRAEGGAYTLTDAGAGRLEQARTKFPVLPPVGVPATPDGPAMREVWEAFVLLKLAEATGFTLGESGVFVGGYPKGSKLNEATAWVLYGELAKAGHVTPRWNGAEGEYTLTPKGLRHLAGLSFDGFPEVTIKGAALTALLSAARGGGKTASPPTAPPPADLEAAVMDAFHRLLRERHSVTRMVPIHEVRADIRSRYGDAAATHDTLDAVILNLWRSERLRISSLEDAGAATHAQHQDSIPGVGETLFYLESAHDSAVV